MLKVERATACLHAGFEVPEPNLLVGFDEGGNGVSVGFLAWVAEPRGSDVGHGWRIKVAVLIWKQFAAGEYAPRPHAPWSWR